jgi:hypothetical protein
MIKGCSRRASVTAWTIFDRTRTAPHRTAPHRTAPHRGCVARRRGCDHAFRQSGHAGSKNRKNLTPIEFVTIISKSMALAAEFRLSTLVALVLILARFLSDPIAARR